MLFRDRELASNILDRLYGKTLKPDDLQVGFSRLVGAVDDLALDVPQAHEFLTKSLVRAARARRSCTVLLCGQCFLMETKRNRNGLLLHISVDPTCYVVFLQARAVVDELLPPAFLGDRYRLHFGGIGGMQVLRKAQKWLCEQPGKAASERFRKVCNITGAFICTDTMRDFVDSFASRPIAETLLSLKTSHYMYAVY